MSTSNAEKIIAKCELAYPLYSGDCVDFAADVLKHFFTLPDFDGNVLADSVVKNLLASPAWTQTRSIAEAITAAKAGNFVIAGLRAADLGSANGHLAIVAGLDGQLSTGNFVNAGASRHVGWCVGRRDMIADGQLRWLVFAPAAQVD